ncbi:MAG: hypothetical protein AB1Z98_21515 [Nannocystaceae bacterium]
MGMAPPRSLVEVPFEHAQPRRLLGLERPRATPDHDYDRYGWTVVRDLVLEDERERRELAEALVLALHSADEPSPGASSDGELELELDVPDPAGGEPLTVLAPLQAFLAAHLGGLADDSPDVVLALCNPNAVAIERPPGLASRRRLHYAHGDVTSWLDVHDDGRAVIRLRATSWHQR